MISVLLLLRFSTAMFLTRDHPWMSSKPLASQELAQEALQSSSDYCVISGVSGYSGFIPVLADNSSMYYWLTNKLGTDITTDTSPLIMWLDGGPGGSSFNGNLHMVGPLYINASLVPVPRAFTWASNYHLLFIDNSIGVGYSFATNESDYCSTETQVATNLYTTLLGLNTLHPQWFLNRDLYIFGVSYAGKYIPSIAAHILQMNQSPGQVHFPLRGIGIGDGLTDPITQVADFANYGFAAGLIDEGERAVAQEYVRQVIQAIEREDWEVVNPAIQKAYEYIVLQGGNFSKFDTRSFNFTIPPYGFTWAGQNATKSLLHVPLALQFDVSSSSVFNALMPDIGKSVKSLFPYLLQHIKILLYNGQDDPFISPSGAQNWIDSIVWPGQMGFLAAKKEVWTVQGQVAGYRRSFEGLTYVTVLNAGHGVEVFQPENAMAMVISFIENNN